MEHEFYRDEFEQLLKDSTDDFKMYPSRKVWHSIYNDLHPDRKWPSFAVCLLLLTAILYLGVSNNNSINSASRNNTAPVAATEESSSSSATAATTGTINNQQVNGSATTATGPSQVDAGMNDEQLRLKTMISIAGLTGETGTGPAVETGNQPVVEGTENIAAKAGDITIAEKGRTAIHVSAGVLAEEETNEIADIDTKAERNTVARAENTIATEESNIVGPASSTALAALRASFKEPHNLKTFKWSEENAMHSKNSSIKKMLSGMSSQFYITPSIGYRVMFKNKRYNAANENALIAANNLSRSAYEATGPNQQGALSIEAGGGFIKPVSNKLRIKTGFQFNYTDFITNAEKLTHSTTTTLVLNDLQGNDITLQPYSTMYANVPGKNNDKLHTKIVQLSIPVGMDYKLMSKRRFDWYAGASIQPTYVAGGYAYMPSSDNNFYVEDESLLRKWNLNAGFETFLSIKTKNNAFINIGPQFRYQLMSTYTERYIYTEKPYTIGFKIGFTTPL
ncbi:MAG: hypothetical protein QM687_05470 [Ferruginibacter sp.]